MSATRTTLAGIGDSRPVALVTGGVHRVGAATCHALAAAGLDVVLTSRTRDDAAGARVASVRQLGVAAAAIPLDLADLDAVERAADRLVRELPRLDVLVHNAAVYEPSPVDSWNPDEAIRQHTINAVAPAVLSTRLASMLGESGLPGGGAIVAMCDIHAMSRPRPGYLAYSMSKAALAEMVHSLARDLAPAVRVNGVAPGAVAFAETGPDSDPDRQRRYLSRVPLGRTGRPEDAAEAVRWLALDAHYTTGQIIRVDGGRWIT